MDVMTYNLYSTIAKFLVLFDYCDSLLKLAHFQDDSLPTAFRAYLYRWIATFDAPYFTLVDRGSNPISAKMVENLRSLDSPLYPIANKSPWSHVSNERSHCFIHKVMEKLLLTPQFEPGPNYEHLMAEAKWSGISHNKQMFFLHTTTVSGQCLESSESSLTRSPPKNGSRIWKWRARRPKNFAQTLSSGMRSPRVTTKFASCAHSRSGNQYGFTDRERDGAMESSPLLRNRRSPYPSRENIPNTWDQISPFLRANSSPTGDITTR